MWMLRAWVCTWSSEWVTLSDRYQHSPLPPRFTCRGEFSSTLNPEQPTGPPPPTLLHSLDLTRKLTFLGYSTVCSAGWAQLGFDCGSGTYAHGPLSVMAAAPAGICYVAERKVWYTAKPRGPKQPPPRSKRKSSEIGGGAGSAEAPPVSASGAAVPVDDSAMEADFADDVEVEADDTADGPAEKKLKKSKKSTKEKKEKKKSKKSKKEA